jgi:hypothetical protein
MIGKDTEGHMMYLREKRSRNCKWRYQSIQKIHYLKQRSCEVLIKICHKKTNQIIFWFVFYLNEVCSSLRKKIIENKPLSDSTEIVSFYRRLFYFRLRKRISQ